MVEAAKSSIKPSSSLFSGFSIDFLSATMDRTRSSEALQGPNTDLSKVRAGAITKKSGSKPDHKPAKLEREPPRFPGYYVPMGSRALGPSPRVLRAIARELQHTELEDAEDKSNMNHDETSAPVDDENHLEEQDAGWKDEWEEGSEEVTCVRVPEPCAFNSHLETQDAYIVTSVFQTHDRCATKISEVHQIYSYMADANRAA